MPKHAAGGRRHAHHGTRGSGPLYQGRYKSFPVQADLHFLTVCRYVERNVLRANLVARAEDWAWSSLSRRRQRSGCPWLVPIKDWPVAPPQSWAAFVNRPRLVVTVRARHGLHQLKSAR